MRDNHLPADPDGRERTMLTCAHCGGNSVAVSMPAGETRVAPIRALMIAGGPVLRPVRQHSLRELRRARHVHQQHHAGLLGRDAPGPAGRTVTVRRRDEESHRAVNAPGRAQARRATQ